jgi:signal transduction histidine kinase
MRVPFCDITTFHRTPLRFWSTRGVEVTLDVGAEPPLGEETELLLYRAAAEATRNVERHSAATHVSVVVNRRNGLARLEVTDDGVGFTPTMREQSGAEGHVGLSLLGELVTRVKGKLDVRSEPGSGTTFVLEVTDP